VCAQALREVLLPPGQGRTAGGVRTLAGGSDSAAGALCTPNGVDFDAGFGGGSGAGAATAGRPSGSALYIACGSGFDDDAVRCILGPGNSGGAQVGGAAAAAAAAAAACIAGTPGSAGSQVGGRSIASPTCLTIANVMCVSCGLVYERC
jgi:hypothetical protein